MKLESRIQKLLYYSKHKEYCLQTQMEIFQSTESRLNSIIALISSGSIVAWVFLDDYFYIWVLILISAQIANILKPTFPFRKFLIECKHKLKSIKLLNIEIDVLWLEIKDKKAPSYNSENRCIDLKTQVDTIVVFDDGKPY
jgi:hypothetical protein